MIDLQVSDRLKFLVEYLDLKRAAGDDEADWESFQLDHLTNSSQFTIANKSRQAGFSWTCAAEAVANSILVRRSTSIFVSINQEEAAEKIRYARQIYESLPLRLQPHYLTDNTLEIETHIGSRLISHPCRPIRGKAKAVVYLDEFAHYPKDREIYTSAVPVTSKGGSIRIGSSPLGASGVFWEIMAEKMRVYPGYTRIEIPWWSTLALCRDVDGASLLAPALSTEERVYRFGTPRLINIFENLPLEDFQQEYECAWVDESVSWITWEEIKKNQTDAQEGLLWYRMSKSVEGAFRVIEEVAKAIQEGVIEAAIAVGVDVGRKKDLTEITLIGKSMTSLLPYRCGISLDRILFEDQLAILLKILEVLPVTQMLVDQNGIGMQLAEQVNLIYGVRAQGITFTAPSKELWAVEVRVKMQKGQVPIPLDRDLSYQIHSIRRKVTAAKNIVFDVEANAHHHADKFWSLALAIWAANHPESNDLVVGENVLSDYRG